jgi:hypothetical protein
MTRNYSRWMTLLVVVRFIQRPHYAEKMDVLQFMAPLKKQESHVCKQHKAESSQRSASGILVTTYIS